MKFLALLLLSLSLSTTHAATPVERKVPVTGVYSPRGYDTLDSSEVVVSGYLPNTCHKNPKTTVKVKGHKILVSLDSLYYGPENPFCAEVLIPFVRTVNLGLLEKGEYTVSVNEGTNYGKKVKFNVTGSRGDNGRNQTYANVEHIERFPEKGILKLQGHNPSDCLVLDEIRVLDNGRNTITILPRMKRISQHCPMKMTPFTYNVQVPSEEGRTLIHVRTMYGDSLNTIY